MVPTNQGNRGDLKIAPVQCLGCLDQSTETRGENPQVEAAGGLAATLRLLMGRVDPKPSDFVFEF